MLLSIHTFVNKFLFLLLSQRRYIFVLIIILSLLSLVGLAGAEGGGGGGICAGC
jgi:hypothetical protein